MALNREGRGATAPAPLAEGALAPAPTFTGNRGLRIEEALLFEVGRREVTGVDLPEPPAVADRLGGLRRKQPTGLPGLAEPEAMRHYVRLSRFNYGIDNGMFPLGSCTMKHNPRLNERMARLPGIADIHPLQPVSTVQGALELMHTLSRWLLELTGMAAITLSPKAGAHGELAGMMAIKAALEARGQGHRKTVLVPESAHGTNPATAALLGYRVVSVPARDDGTVDPAEVIARLSPDVAAIMLTNPNTCGLFERDVVAIAAAVHAAGALFYGDGANFNAIVGKTRIGDLGVDAMHINLHKTFSTPHGGGGPGAGPVVLSAALAPFAPVPHIVRAGEGFALVEAFAPVSSPAERSEGKGTQTLAPPHAADEKVLDPLPEPLPPPSPGTTPEVPFGRMCAFHGQMGMFVRAMSYMLSHGSDGLRQASEDAVLAANYVRARLADLYSLPFGDRPCMHEVLFDDASLKDSGITTLDIAKALIDEGYHPMTVYFPLVVHGAMLIEPTESESKASLDLFIAAMRDLAFAAKAGDTARFKDAPRFAPRRRLDETRAARSPRLRWTPPEGPIAEAAE